MSKNRPLVYQWIASYNNGISLPQFDPYDYHENAFKDINQDELKKFSLYPFTKEFEKGIRKTGEEVVSIPFLPKYQIDLSPQKRLIYYRDVFISQEQYHLCRSCNKEFYYIPEKIKQTELTIYPSPICPNCGKHDVWKCRREGCGKIYQRFEDAPGRMCGDCKSHLERIRITSGQFGREKRWIEYYLGYQSTINNRNIKFLLKIKENGDCEII